MIWDPDRNLFVFPYINHAVTWYGLLFAVGFFVGFFIIRKLVKPFFYAQGLTSGEATGQTVLFSDRLAFWVACSGVIGARVGHIFFYDWHHYSRYPLDMFKIWEGGLASHGGALAIILALYLFSLRYKDVFPRITFLVLLDLLCIPAAFAAGCIRLGNFINQEITGLPTTLPWGITFGHPVDGPQGIPLHPVQLYEALFYFVLFFSLFLYFKKRVCYLGRGLISGLFLVALFSFRLAIEPLKAPQNMAFDAQHLLSMGQFLSLPFICLGLFLLIRDRLQKTTTLS